MQAIKQVGKVLASSVGMALIVVAFLFAWLAFVCEGGGRFDAAVAFLSLGIGAGSLGGGVLSFIWVRNI